MLQCECRLYFSGASTPSPAQLFKYTSLWKAEQVRSEMGRRNQVTPHLTTFISHRCQISNFQSFPRHCCCIVLKKKGEQNHFCNDVTTLTLNDKLLMNWHHHTCMQNINAHSQEQCGARKVKCWGGKRLARGDATNPTDPSRSVVGVRSFPVVDHDCCDVCTTILCVAVSYIGVQQCLSLLVERQLRVRCVRNLAEKKVQNVLCVCY